jgi:O-acetylhomoserine (thiol)-lyase
MVKPIELGANVVIHSLTKWMGGHGIALGGAVIDGGNFDWGQNDKFPMLTTPHFGYQGAVLWEEFGPAALSVRIRTEGMMNVGPCMSPQNAFYILQGPRDPWSADGETYVQHRSPVRVPRGS